MFTAKAVNIWSGSLAGAPSWCIQWLGSQRAEGGLLGTLGITSAASTVESGFWDVEVTQPVAQLVAMALSMEAFAENVKLLLVERAHLAVGGLMEDWMMGGARGTADTTTG